SMALRRSGSSSAIESVRVETGSALRAGSLPPPGSQRPRGRAAESSPSKSSAETDEPDRASAVLRPAPALSTGGSDRDGAKFCPNKGGGPPPPGARSFPAASQPPPRSDKHNTPGTMNELHQRTISLPGRRSVSGRNAAQVSTSGE